LLEQIANLGLKCTRTDAIFIKFNQKMNFKFSKNVQRDMKLNEKSKKLLVCDILDIPPALNYKFGAGAA
jgi:hypothetical protein